MSTQSTDSESSAGRRALELRLEAMQERNRKLRAQLDIQHTKNEELHAALVESSVVAEVEEEHISNGLLRRLESLRKDKDQLDAQLQKEEKQKGEKEQLLLRLKKNRTALERHLRQEEVEIAEKLQRQLNHTQAQRIELQSKVMAESATLQQLHDCIRSLRDGCRPSPSLSPAKAQAPQLPPLGGSDQQEHSGADAAMTTVLSSSTCSALRSSAMVGETADTSPMMACRSPSVASAAATVHTDAVTPLGGSTYSEGTPLSSRRAFTGDNGMLRLLESEIQVADNLRRDAERRVEEYAQRVAVLQAEILEAERDREAQRASAELMKAELIRTTSTVSEMHANQEVAAEWTMDREILGGCAHHPRSSSLCSTISSHTSAAAIVEVPLEFNVPHAPTVLHGSTHVTPVLPLS